MAGTNRRAAQPPRRSASRAAATPKRPRRFFDYPRSGYHGLHRWLPSWRFLVGTFLTICFLGLGAVVAAYALTPIPNPADDTAKQASTVYYANNADGSRGPVMGTFAVQRREIVDFATLPDYVGNAVVSSEDRTFWKNSGVSITGTARAFLNNIRGGATQGGSTLTQQYAERYYTSGTTSDYLGKAKEAILALKIAREQDKKVILGNYLNTIYFGRDAYGIESAAQAYYNKDVENLTPAEAAYVAAAIQVPTYAGDLSVPGAEVYMQARWQYVVNGMVQMHTITAQEAAALKFPTPAKQKQKSPEPEQDEDEEILGGGSTLTAGETTQESGEEQLARQRDTEPDDYDGDTVVDPGDDRVRGAGQQSLDEIAITRGQGLGLAEHIGGIRHDRPEPNVNDPDPGEATVEEAV